MIIHLSEDLEQIVQDAVRTGLDAREDDVVRDALTRLRGPPTGHATHARSK
jgi:Arc/MetJ-type ribon-helix-helix transcriptional regulator